MDPRPWGYALLRWQAGHWYACGGAHMLDTLMIMVYEHQPGLSDAAVAQVEADVADAHPEDAIEPEPWWDDSLPPGELGIDPSDLPPAEHAKLGDVAEDSVGNTHVFTRHGWAVAVPDGQFGPTAKLRARKPPKDKLN